MPLCEVRQTTDGFDVEQLISCRYDESSITLDDVPRFEFQVPNLSGIEAYRLFVGDEIGIHRAGALAMPGIIEDVAPTQGGGKLTSHTAKGLHTGYALLQAKKLTNFDFDEDGLAATTRDGVTINPHRRFIFRAPNGTLGVDGLPPGLDGVPFEVAAKACIGTKVVHQIDFQDNTYLMPSQVYATTNTIQVYRDGPQSQTRPALQRTRNGTNFKTGVEIHSIPLYGNDPNVNVGGIISTVDVIFIGKRDAGSNNITVSVCRNASAVPASRTYTSVTLTYTANSPATGYDKWVGTVDLSAGGESVKNVLGFKIQIAGGTGTTDTTYAYYGKLTATAASDSGISEGSIAAYDNPFTIGGSENWVEADLQGESALSGLEKLRKMTASDPAVNTNPNWDMWVDSNLAFNFAERRGAAIAKPYSFAEGNLKVIEHKYLGGDVRYQTIAYGPGSGDSQTRIVSKQAFTSGGLYDADRDWTVNPSTATYGRRARIGDFVDAGETSVVNLLRKAYADHKLHRNPIENIRAELVAEFLPFFTVGDSIPITNLPTRTSATPRVVKMSRSFSGSQREQLDVEFGQVIVNIADRMHNNSDQSASLTYHIVPNDAQIGISGNGLYFDATHFGAYSLPIADGSAVKGVKLRMGVLPWQAHSKSAAGGSGAVVTVPNVAQAIYDNAAPMPPYFGNHQHTDQYNGANQPTTRVIATAITGGGASGNFVFQISVPPATAGNYTIAYGGQNGTSGTKTMQFEVRKNSASGTVLATGASTSLAAGAFIVDWAIIPLGSGTSQIQNGDTIYVCCTTANFTVSDNVQLRTVSNDQHTHAITLPSHTHTLVYGIFQFGGDSVGDSVAALYGKDISFAVDPTIAAGTGIPTAAEIATAQYPATIGHSQTVPGTYEFDITGWLATEANGIIKSGEHRVFFKGLAGSDNALGLSVLSVTPIFDYKRS